MTDTLTVSRELLRQVDALTQARLKEVLWYRPETGEFRWRCPTSNTAKPWMLAGSKTSQGYVTMRIDGVMHKAHRLAWLYMHGSMPDNYIDHINRVRTDNRISNLRPADKTENQWNISTRSDSTSGVRGVSVCADKTFRVQIRVNKRLLHLGRFKNLEDAKAVRLKAELEFWGGRCFVGNSESEAQS